MAPLTVPAVLNLAEFVSLEDVKELDIKVPLSILHCGFKCSPSLCVSSPAQFSPLLYASSVSIWFYGHMIAFGCSWYTCASFLTIFMYCVGFS